MSNYSMEKEDAHNTSLYVFAVHVPYFAIDELELS
jgi:hypothetical protein